MSLDSPLFFSRPIRCQNRQMVSVGSRFDNSGASAVNDYWREINADLPSRSDADQDGYKGRRNPKAPHACKRWGFSSGNLGRGGIPPDT
jgi:hypothetical protein